MPFVIEKADRSKTKVVLSLAGDTGTGKTLSAIRIARGFVGEKGKIGFIDTEQRRASVYAESYGGFDVINLEPPYTPERYQEAVETFKEAGFDVVIIDSMSHEWEGVGGILEIAENQTYASGKPMVGLDKWCKPKIRHRKMMSYLLNCGMHLVLCYRVKRNMIETTDEKGRKVMVRSEDETVVTEGSVDYDFTVKLLLDKNKIPRIDRKCPEALEYLFNKDMATEQTGADIVEWLTSKQRNAEAIIEEGKKQKDLRKWFGTLNKFEAYLARKYASKIKELAVIPEAPKMVEEIKETDQDIIEEVEL